MKTCTKCEQEIFIPSAGSGWPEKPLAIGICVCQHGMPTLQEGDILVDRNYDAFCCRVLGDTYGYRAENIMSIQRPNNNRAWVVIWKRETGE